jgi:subtilisin family serine protease
VGLNHVTPTGIVMKGFGGPEPSAGDPPERPDAGPGRPVPVAVIDTGIAAEERTDGWLTSEEIQRSQANTDLLNVFSGGATLDLGAGHGTSSAGVVQQVAPGVELRIYKALDSDGVGTEVDVACAMVQAVRDGAQVVNLSLGVETADDQPPLAFEVALELIDEMEAGREVIIVAAAGNTGRDRPVWPAAFRRVVAVAGLTQAFAPAAWSTRWSRIDCSTLGEGVRSTYVEGQESPVVDIFPDRFPQNAWALQTGTSFAAPQVAGAIARYAQEQRTTPREALRKLLEGTPRLPGYGRVLRVLEPTLPPQPRPQPAQQA